VTDKAKMKHRLPTKQSDLRPLKGPPSSGLRGGAYGGPSVNKGRSDITQVAAYEPGHKGAKPPKSRKQWF